jgi:type II secretory pathway pseudopilin PulG
MLKKAKFGFALIEVLIAVTIISGALIIIVSSTTQSLSYSYVTLKNYQATLATEEAVEAVKAIKIENWTNNISTLVSGTNYGITLGLNNWQTTPTPQTTDLGFTRTIVLDDVYRDANDDIATSGTLDSGVKKVTITTTWSYTGRDYSQIVEFYIFNIV